MDISRPKQILWTIAAGLAGALALTAVYIGIVSLAEGPKHAVELFIDDRWIVLPIILGFGVQTALYTVLKKRWFIPVAQTGASGRLMAGGGATSTAAMVACCAHHVTDVLPILGLSAASAFLAEYRIPFMVAGLVMNLIGIGVMSGILLKERRKALQAAVNV
jgi:hypothetical protein